MNTLSTKECSTFLRFGFLLKLFLFSSETKMRWIKLIKSSLVINRMRKNRNILCKESNLWTFLFVSFNSFLLKSLWEVGAGESKKIFNWKELFFVESFSRKSKIFFNKAFWYVKDEPCISKQKLNYIKEKWSPLLCWEAQKKLFQPRKPPEIFVTETFETTNYLFLASMSSMFDRKSQF